MTYRIGLAMARRGYLTLASSRPSQLARFLSSHMAIYKGTAGTGHCRIPTTTGGSASSRLAVRRQLLELASGAGNVRSLKKTCCISFGTGVRALGGLGEALQVLKRDS